MKSDGNIFTFKLSEKSTMQLAGTDASGSASVSAMVGAIGLSQLQYTVSANGQLVTVTIEYRNVGTSPKVTIPV